MFRKWLFLLPISAAVLASVDQPWKDKPAGEWNQDDTRQILNDSPWAKSVTPTLTDAAGGQRRSGMGRNGIGIGGIGIGLPGMGGMGRRGGMGGPGGGGGGYPGGGSRSAGNDTGSADSQQPPALKLRWESALPVREAELQARETDAPTLGEDSYAIAVYGVPRHMADADSQKLAGQLKKLAAIKRDGKKDFKPSSVEVLQREDGPVIVYLFPRSKEITKQDRRVEFDGQIGRLHFVTSFYIDDMTYNGKLDL